MKKTGFSLTNHFGSDIQIFLEPAGARFDLLPEDKIDILLVSETADNFDFQVDKNEDGLCFSIWPTEGNYLVLYNGKEIV